jgi:WD40 repeat protein
MWESGGVSLRDPATGQERASFKQFDSRGSGLVDILALTYSPNAQTLASAGYSHIRLSDAATGKELTVVKTGIPSPIRALAYSPDGKTLASCNENVVQFWDVAAALQLAAKSSR